MSVITRAPMVGLQGFDCLKPGHGPLGYLRGISEATQTNQTVNCLGGCGRPLEATLNLEALKPHGEP